MRAEKFEGCSQRERPTLDRQPIMPSKDRPIRIAWVRDARDVTVAPPQSLNSRSRTCDICQQLDLVPFGRRRVSDLPRAAALAIELTRALPQQGCDDNQEGAQQIQTWMPSMQEKANKGKLFQYFGAFSLVGNLGMYLERAGIALACTTQVATTRAATVHVYTIHQHGRLR
jgi:hypothetical protein